MSLAAATYIGVEFQVTTPGWLNGFRWYLNGSQTGWFLCQENAAYTRRAAIWQWNPTSTATGWHQSWFLPRILLDTASSYRLVCMCTSGGYFRNNSALTSPVTRGNITFIRSFQTTAINPFGITPTFNTNANAVDVLIDFK